MKLLKLNRSALLRLVLTIPVAFLIVGALQYAGVAGSCGSDGDLSSCGGGNNPYSPPGGGGPPPCQTTWTPYYNGSDQWIITESQHNYRVDFTIQGKRTDSCTGTAYALDTQTAHSLGQEMCPPTGIDQDWNLTASAPGINPFTLSGNGGWASGSTDCVIAGHWVTASGQADFEDALTNVHENGAFGFYHCFLIYPTPPGTGTPPGC